MFSRSVRCAYQRIKFTRSRPSTSLLKSACRISCKSTFAQSPLAQSLMISAPDRAWKTVQSAPHSAPNGHDVAVRNEHGRKGIRKRKKHRTPDPLLKMSLNN